MPTDVMPTTCSSYYVSSTDSTPPRARRLYLITRLLRCRCATGYTRITNNTAINQWQCAKVAGLVIVGVSASTVHRNVHATSKYTGYCALPLSLASRKGRIRPKTPCT